MPLLGLTTMDELSCVPANTASTQGWTSERAVEVERGDCLGLGVARVNVEPKSHKGFGLLSRRLTLFRTSRQGLLMTPFFCTSLLSLKGGEA